MRKLVSLNQPHMKAKLFGVLLICVGVLFVLIPDAVFLKLGFGCILIGLFMIVMITERTVPETMSNAQIQGHTNVVQQITNQLNLKGNAVFLPQNGILNNERVFIPLKSTQPIIPSVDDEMVFATGADGTSIGLSLPPSGMLLLSEVEKETTFDNTDMEYLEEKLQTFVGMNILKSITLKQKDDRWQLELMKPLYCTQMSSLCKQYPCPSCSAVFTAITKATGLKIRIEDAMPNGKKTTFYFSVMKE